MEIVIVIWLLLLLLGVLALAGLALPRDVRRPREISAWLAENAEQKRAEAERRSAEAAECVRYAEEIAVAAHGAETTAERRRAECQQAQARVEECWTAYRTADAALQRARRAAAYPVRESIDPADREHALRRAAQAAYRRGDLSDEQLLDALTHRNGWNPHLHPAEQELLLARAAAAHRLALYRAALTAEDAAWRASDIATAAVRSLRREAAAATARADAARAALPRQEHVPDGHRQLRFRLGSTVRRLSAAGAGDGRILTSGPSR
jgi:hypothetical protein